MSGIPENERKQHFHRNETKRNSETKFTEKEQFDFIFLSNFFKNNSEMFVAMLNEPGQ